MGVGVRVGSRPGLLTKYHVLRYNTVYTFCNTMSDHEKTISFRANSDDIAQLDSLATAQDRPRSYLINEAIRNYIDLHAYQDELVRKGLEDVRAGRVVSHKDVVARFRDKTKHATR